MSIVAYSYLAALHGAHCARRAHCRARLARLVVTYRDRPTVSPYAHNRPGKN